jgi:succinate dehydrogenase / fumarate reductase iron-sulfur subunit
MSLKGKKQDFTILRGEGEDASLEEFSIELDEGMVVLDCVHRIQHEQQPDLAVRWNCKAGKCGSCSAEINGRPRLMCMTRMSDVVAETPAGKPIEIRPMKAFPHVKDLVTDVSWNYEMAQKIKPINGPDEMNWEFNQMEADRVQQFRECIECFLCVNTCHVLRDHALFDDFAGPRNLVRLAQYEMHPLDTEDRVPEIKKEFGIEYCNITRCCTEVCPAGIQITDDAIIQLKERVVDRYYDPLQRIWRTITRKKVRY